MNSENKMFLSSSPHFTSGLSTQKIMLAVLISLLPECVYGVIVFGLPALTTILVSVASCFVFEFFFRKSHVKKLLFQICHVA